MGCGGFRWNYSVRGRMSIEITKFVHNPISNSSPTFYFTSKIVNKNFLRILITKISRYSTSHKTMIAIRMYKKIGFWFVLGCKFKYFPLFRRHEFPFNFIFSLLSLHFSNHLSKKLFLSENISKLTKYKMNHV